MRTARASRCRSRTSRRRRIRRPAKSPRSRCSRRCASCTRRSRSGREVVINAAFDPEKVARYVLAEHERRADYRNLPAEIAPGNVAQAYAAQIALVRLLTPRKGKVAGLKIATTTKIMQQLMGIDHPCGGTIFEKTVHASPAQLRLSDYQHVVIECELAVKLARDLPAAGAPYTAKSVAPAVGAVMPAFELIEDRNADYKQTNVVTLIADNCWN